MEIHDLYWNAYPIFQKLGLTQQDTRIIHPEEMIGRGLTGPFRWFEFSHIKQIFDITGNPIDVIHDAGMINDEEKLFLQQLQLNGTRHHNLELDNGKVYIEYGRRRIAPRKYEDTPTMTIRFYKLEFFKHFRNKIQKVAMVELILKSLMTLHQRYTALHEPSLADFGNEDF